MKKLFRKQHTLSSAGTSAGKAVFFSFFILHSSLLFLVLLLAGCRGEDEPLPLPDEPEVEQYLITAVFAPDQLGDNGYADNVFHGVSQLARMDEADSSACRISVDADFISCRDFTATRQAVEDWVNNSSDPINGREYTRRLLVLTEPFMAGWLGRCKEQLRPTDEVLLLKVIDEDVAAVNDSLQLGRRIHAINISMSDPIRMFCETIGWYVDNQEDFDVHFNVTDFPIFRLYSDDLTPRRDSVCETIIEKMGEGVFFSKTDYYMKGSDDIPQSVLGLTSLEDRLSFLLMSFQQMWRNGMFFPVCDMGATNAALDYFLLDHSDQLFQPLLLDAGPSIVDRIYILRPFDSLLIDWVTRWLQSEVGTMPVAEMHGHWDGYPCMTNMSHYD